MSDFELAMSATLRWEGGLVSLNDGAGLTNFGITLKFLRAIDSSATEKDVKNLTIDDAKQLYLEHFWQPNNYGKINSQKVANKVFDLSVNCGNTMANQFLQKGVNLLDYTPDLKVDGIIGPASIAAINSCHPDALCICLKYNAIAYYAALIAAKSNMSAFKKGWLNRCCSDS